MTVTLDQLEVLKFRLGSLGLAMRQDLGAVVDSLYTWLSNATEAAALKHIDYENSSKTLLGKEGAECMAQCGLSRLTLPCLRDQLHTLFESLDKVWMTECLYREINL